MRVLHVEDNPFDVDLTRRHMARLDPDIALEHAPDMASALRQLDDSHHFDAVLADIKLPDGSGLDLLARVRERSLPLAVVMLTGSGDQHAAVAALQAGADDYLVKGTPSLDRLPATLRQAVRRSSETRRRRARPLRVLYAEHNPADIDLAHRHLARHAPHISLSVVANAAEVLARLPEHPGEAAAYDVVLLDYRLPGIDALEAVKVLRGERGLDIPIVIVSGQGSEEVAAQAIHLGVDDYVSKHAGYLHELPATLEKVHRQAELSRERSMLRETSARLGQMLASSPVVLFTWRFADAQLAATWVSGNIERLLGYTEAEVLRSGWWADHIDRADRDAVIARLSDLRRAGHIALEYRIRDQGGRLRWIQDELRLDGDGGSNREIIGVWRDVTESRLAEQVRETRVAVLDGLVTHQPLPVILGSSQKTENKAR